MRTNTRQESKRIGWIMRVAGVAMFFAGMYAQVVPISMAGCAIFGLSLISPEGE